MDLKKYISPKSGFQSSVNIAYDLHREDKVKDFIPTKAAIDILEDLLLGTVMKSTDRARILIGSYGKGKSHLVLVLMGILQKMNPIALERVFLALKEYKPDLYQYIQNELLGENNLPFLPVIIDGSNSSLSQGFLSALKSSLVNNGLKDLMPTTHYQAAVKMIERWAVSYKETYIAFEHLLNEPMREFIGALNAYDEERYAFFVNVYPRLTSGSEFNPFFGFNIVELYTKVTEAVVTRGYRGIYVVYDEFSKYLEANISSASVSDTRMLQDFAEKCARSGNKQMHLLLIAHKDIANYIDKLPKDKVDGWKGVSERFNHVEVRNNFTQLYEIMGNVIEKNQPLYNKFKERNQGNFERLAFVANSCHAFDDVTDIEALIVSCYPLHPVTTFLLPRLSELVAQNERTLFTFLSTNSKYTLMDFVKRQIIDFPVLAPDLLYDYFEPLFRQEVYTSEIKKNYVLTKNILNQLVDDSLASKLVKTIALIYMVNQFEKLPPLAEILQATYMFSASEQEIYDTLENLQDKKYVVYQKLSNKYLRLKTSTGVDVRQKCRDMAQKNKTVFGLKQILAELTNDIYFYPTQYNDKNEIVRYFSFRFITGQEFVAIRSWNRKIDDEYLEGVVFAIIPESQDEIVELKKKLLQGQDETERCLFVLPNKWIEIQNVAYEYKAISLLREEAINDSLLQEEYNIYFEDVEEVINDFIQCYIKPELRQATYYYCGEKQRVYRKSQLSRCLSSICERLYTMTPVINNEVLNKNELSFVSLHTRSKVVQELLAPKLEPMLGQKGNSQGMSFIKSALHQLGLIKNLDTMPKMVLHDLPDRKVQHVIEIIEEFLLHANGEAKDNFGRLYNILRSYRYHIGLKLGPIPIFLAVVMHFCRQHLIITYKGNEMELTADLLNAIEVHPEDYMVCRDAWDSKKMLYIEKIEELFSEYVFESEKEYSNFSFLIKAMQRWLIGLPAYTKASRKIYCGKGQSKVVDEKYRDFIKSLKKPSINAREYLFNELPTIFSKDNLENTFIGLSDIKYCINNYKVDLIRVLEKDLIQLFGVDIQPETSLSSAIHDWLDTLSTTTLNHVFIGEQANILQLLKCVSNDVDFLIERLAKAVTGLRIADWDDEKVDMFLSSMRKFKRKTENHSLQNEEVVDMGIPDCASLADDYQVNYVDEQGRKQIKTFNKVAYSKRGKLLRNDIEAALESMGEALLKDEKRQVLMEILEKMF